MEEWLTCMIESVQLYHQKDSAATNHPWAGWQRLQTWFMIECSSFCWPCDLLQDKVLVGTVLLVPASLALPNWLWFVYVRIVMWACAFHTCESLQFESGSMVAMAPRQYFHLKNSSVLLCNKGNIIFSSCQSRNCLSQFLAALADIPLSCQQYLLYSRCVRRH